MKLQLILFKFHYDSINSNIDKSNTDDFPDLNSIMILLIQTKVAQIPDSHLNLNSIMILLIQRFSVSMVLCVCDLNSIMILLILGYEVREENVVKKFKFHYDSINSIFLL